MGRGVVSEEKIDMMEKRYNELLSLKKANDEQFSLVSREFRLLQNKLKYYGRLEQKGKIVSLADLNTYQEKYMNEIPELFELEKEYNELRVSGVLYKSIPTNALEKRVRVLYYKIYRKRRKLEVYKIKNKQCSESPCFE